MSILQRLFGLTPSKPSYVPKKYIGTSSPSPHTIVLPANPTYDMDDAQIGGYYPMLGGKSKRRRRHTSRRVGGSRSKPKVRGGARKSKKRRTSRRSSYKYRL